MMKWKAVFFMFLCWSGTAFCQDDLDVATNYKNSGFRIACSPCRTILFVEQFENGCSIPTFWSTQSKSLIASNTDARDFLADACWHPTVPLLAVGYGDQEIGHKHPEKNVRIINGKTGKIEFEARVPDDARRGVQHVSFSPDGHFLMATSSTNLVLWDLETSNVAIQANFYSCVEPKFSTDSKLLFVPSKENTYNIKKFDLSTFQEEGKIAIEFPINLTGTRLERRSVAFAEKKNLIAYITGEELRVTNLKNGESVLTLRRDSGWFDETFLNQNELKFFDDDSKLVILQPNSFRLVNLESGDLEKVVSPAEEYTFLRSFLSSKHVLLMQTHNDHSSPRGIIATIYNTDGRATFDSESLVTDWRSTTTVNSSDIFITSTKNGILSVIDGETGRIERLTDRNLGLVTESRKD